MSGFTPLDLDRVAARAEDVVCGARSHDEVRKELSPRRDRIGSAPDCDELECEPSWHAAPSERHRSWHDEPGSNRMTIRRTMVMVVLVRLAAPAVESKVES
jgi:hypothetical protein